MNNSENDTNKLVISKKAQEATDGYRIFSIRIKEMCASRLDRLSVETNRSRNALINMLLEYALDNCAISSDNEETEPTI